MKKYTHRKKINIPIYPGIFQIVLTTDPDILEEGNSGLEKTSTDDDGILLITVYYNLEAQLFSNGSHQVYFKDNSLSEIQH